MFNSLGLEEESNEGSDSYVMSNTNRWPYHGDITWSPQSRNMIKNQLKKKLCLQDNLQSINVDESDNNDDNGDSK